MSKVMHYKSQIM